MAEPTYTFRQSDLPKLDLNIDKGTDFAAWRTQWDSYCFLSGLADEDTAKQVRALTLCLSRETLATVHNLGLSEAQMKKPSAIIEALQRYVDGHINETVERRNFRRRTQQQGEAFDDYLISLRELAKTCKFCSDTCLQKNIRDQIIEGLCDGDTVEDLLQESDLTLATTITKCRSKEAAKKNRSQILAREQETEVVAALHNPQLPTQQGRPHTCPGCGGAQHKGGRVHCPAYDKACSNCHKVGHFARVCRSKQRLQQQAQNNSNPHPSANAIRLQPPQGDHIQLYNIKGDKAEPAPTITVKMTSSSGSTPVTVLPDSGADISAAGQAIVGILGHQLGNLIPSEINPRAVNGTCMKPLGKIPVTISLQGRAYRDNIHIFPGVSGAIISWKAAKELSILLPQYPQLRECHKPSGTWRLTVLRPLEVATSQSS